MIEKYPGINDLEFTKLSLKYAGKAYRTPCVQRPLLPAKHTQG